MMRRIRNKIHALVVLTALIIAGLNSGTVSHAQSSSGENVKFDSKMFSALRWRNIGPDRGGRSIASSGSPSRPNEYYFGAVGGGLWKTDDGGLTWRPVTDGQIKSSSVGAVAVAESNPDIVYIGMGETELRGNIMQGDGVYKTTDGGKTWTHLGLDNTQAIARIRVNPSNPDLVYVAAFGHPYGPNEERGVFRSKDGGKTWQKVLYRNNRVGAVDLTIDRNNPNTLYAALWDAYRTSWTLSSGGPGSGLFKSTDGGDNWTEITRNPGLPKGIIGKIGVTVSGADSNRVYAIVEAEDGGVFKSDDAGSTWTKVSEDRNVRQRAFYYSRIYADPKNKDTIYVLNVNFHKSTDGGKTFRTLREPHGDNHDLWIDPNNPLRMINSNDGGANVSINGGQTWTRQDFPTAQLYHVATTKDYPYQVCGAQQDNSTVCVPSEARGRRGGESMYAVGGGESGYIAPHPTNPNLFYAGSQGALLTRFDRTTGQTRDIQVYPRFFSGQPASSLKERWQWTFPIVFSPMNPKVMYTSSQHLWRTTNDGQSWEQISPDLTRADPKTLGDSGGPITKDQNGPEIYGTIFTIAPSRLEENTIWTGSDDGLAYITRDGGKHWDNITPKGLPDFIRISLIEASPSKPGTAYMAAKNYQADDRAPYIYRTDDYGKSWTKIVNGIPSGDYVHAVREDPKRPGLLYAGTEHGIFVSFDNGSDWQSLSLNLPDTQVSDIVVEENDLVIATHGRSFYVLDDISPLRQLTSQAIASSAFLFQPKVATRSVDQAVIDYYLKDAADKVTIDILDEKGQLVRSFSSEDAAANNRRRGGDNQDSEFGPPQPRGLEKKAGLNRFTWDLRYPGSVVFPGMILWSARAESGPVAVPGTYQVRLTANGQTITKGFTVRKDPRSTDVTQADLQAQFDLAIKIRDRESEANSAVIMIRDIKKQIDDRTTKANDPKLTSAGDDLKKRLSAIEEDLYQVKNRSGQDPLNFPIKLNNLIAALERVVESADAPPTDQSYVVFKELSAELDVLLGRLDDEVKTYIPGFNQKLDEKKLEPIKVEKVKQ
ncbi:MAG TPA: glycosyl hydrolase [Blastocatellia bacterium]|nr:glycosyl hydrolase [Blastocatellia bacterium]